MKKRVVTIHVYQNEPTGQTIRASVRGLDRENRNAVIERIHSEALKLIAVRGMRRRLRPPYEIHFVESESGAHTLVGVIEAKDSRGRKAAVKIKISGLALASAGKERAAAS